jgi:hypothetical protein
MKRTYHGIFIKLMILSLLLVHTTGVFGQASTTPTPEVDMLTSQQKATIGALRGLIQSIESLKEQIAQTEKDLAAAETEEQKARLGQKLNELGQELEGRKRDFEAIATGVELEIFTIQPRESFDLRAEIQEVVGPILIELKKITERPREIERLRNEVAYYEKRIPVAETAIKNIQTRIEQADSQLLIEELEAIQKKWEQRKTDMENQLRVVQYQLNERLEGERSLLKSLQGFFQSFFKNRGLNLILALGVFFGIFLGLRFLKNFFSKAKPGDQNKKRSFSLRLATILYQGIIILAALSSALLVFYVSGDWVLLGLALIFLFGFAWTAKQAVPMYWEQIKLLLNMSTVREHERLLYNGLPWKVVSLGFYTKLHNPALKGGLLRLSIKELFGLRSRPFYKHEPWFPCEENDWVLLADGTFGQVLMQTPEIVQLEIVGGSYKTYPTLEFLHQNPNNLSAKNFGVFVTFGIDYAHQETITQEIPDLLHALLIEKLSQYEFGRYLESLNVIFKKAGASSLDLQITAVFSGQAAPHYIVIPKTIQRIAVDACNHYGWVIPFMQITMHHAKVNTPNA